MSSSCLARYVADAGEQVLPPHVVEAAKMHILDTVAAVVSGSALAPGRLVKAWVEAQGGSAEATVLGSSSMTTVQNAALANGVMAHSDETDDSHARSQTHPGCAIVPAALAVAEARARSGTNLIRAVTVGYDVGTRIAEALGSSRFFDLHHASHAFGGIFGAAAAAASLEGFDALTTEHCLAFAVQLASGNSCWTREGDRLEKSYVFGGMPAHNGVMASSLVSFGFTGSNDPIHGDPGLLAAFPQEADPDAASRLLGERFEVCETTIKKWCVGTPIQSCLDSLEQLMAEQRFSVADVVEMNVNLPRRKARVVDRNHLPDLNLQYQLSVMLLDGKASFLASHDETRMRDPSVGALMDRIHVSSRDDSDSPQAVVRIKLRDGRELSHQVAAVRGSPANPMTRYEVVAKAQDLMSSVIGDRSATTLVKWLVDLDAIDDVRVLRPLLQAPIVDDRRDAGS